MRTAPLLLALLMPAALGACANGELLRTEITQEIEVDQLVGLEKDKWRVAATDPAAFAAMLTEDFLAVEPGDTPREEARRMNKAQLLARLPLPASQFEVQDVRVVRPTPNSAILSYRVSGRDVPFAAFATSHWARRDGQWVTVFYQSTVVLP